MGRIDNSLAPALSLPVHGDLARTVSDAHPIRRDRHCHALADQTPGHRVAVRIDIDRAIVADHAGELAQRAERRPVAERLNRCASSRSKRTAGASPVVPGLHNTRRTSAMGALTEMPRRCPQ
jgi:hypothetical protein